MAGKTGIEWTDTTWNPVTGCTKVSPGCANCYAETVANRFWAKTQPVTLVPTAEGETCRPRAFTDVRCHPERLDQPLRWRKPHKVFVNSMSDLFHEDVPDAFIDEVFGTMADARRHTFQILTKRANRMLAYMATRTTRHCQPLPNVWLGVSVENQRFADERIPLLLETPAAVRFVSYEPALGPVDFWQWLPREVETGQTTSAFVKGIKWLVVGGESGKGARPFHVEWARDVVRQCRAAGVACFVKQMGRVPVIQEVIPGIHGPDAIRAQRAIDLEWPIGTHFGNPTGDPRLNGRVVHLKHKKGGDWSEWPEDLRVREFPTTGA